MLASPATALLVSPCIAWASLQVLSNEFRRKAVPIARVLVLESHMPYDQRTASRFLASDQFGGTAGGQKYLVPEIDRERGLFFKLCDSVGIYGDLRSAHKAAKHDFKGFQALLSAGVRGLHFPLTALVSFLGQRVLIQSCVPVSGTDTLQCVGARVLVGTTVLANVSTASAVMGPVTEATPRSTMMRSSAS